MEEVNPTWTCTRGNLALDCGSARWQESPEPKWLRNEDPEIGLLSSNAAEHSELVVLVFSIGISIDCCSALCSNALS